MSPWTSPSDLRERLAKRWNRGIYLSALANHESFAPIDLKITGPKTAELNSRRTEVTEWVALWHDQARRPETEVAYRTVGGRGLTGTNRLPDRLHIASLDDLERFLRVDSHDYRDLLDLTDDRPPLRAWVADRPI